MAFSGASGLAFLLKIYLENILEVRVPLRMIFASKSFFDVLTRAMIKTENGLILDIQTVRDVYQTFEITDVALVRFNFNIADVLTKNKAHFVMK